MEVELKEVKQLAKERMKGTCRVCPVCNGKVCAGEVPGMGGSGTGMGFINNIEALSRVKILMRTIHEAKNPTLEADLFGQTLSMPIIVAPITGSEINFGGYLSEEAYVHTVVEGAHKVGTLAMTGDSGKPEYYQYGLNAIEKVKGQGIPTIKPREVDAVLMKVREAEAQSVPAIAMDVDGAGLVTMALLGQPVGPKTKQEMQTIISQTEKPFIVKGVMTVDEALLCVELGAKAIVVSNHGGRVLDDTVGVADVLPEIAKAVKGKLKIIADSGVRSGIDVFKYIALGADLVLVGRPIIVGAVGGGVQGVELVLDKYKNELYRAMILTGASSVEEISADKIWIQA